jgi:hypothetical protein
MLRLEDLIGKKVLVTIAGSTKACYRVTLHGVETGGLWIESEEMAKRIGNSAKKASTGGLEPKQKSVFFIPYHQVAFLVAASTELDERSFEG